MKTILSLLLFCVAINAHGATYMLLSQTNTFANNITKNATNAANAYADSIATWTNKLGVFVLDTPTPMLAGDLFEVKNASSNIFWCDWNGNLYNGRSAPTTGDALTIARDSVFDGNPYTAVNLFSTSNGVTQAFVILKTDFTGTTQLDLDYNDGTVHNWIAPTISQSNAYIPFNYSDAQQSGIASLGLKNIFGAPWLFNTVYIGVDDLISTFQTNGTTRASIFGDGSITTGGNTNRWIFGGVTNGAPDVSVDGTHYPIGNVQNTGASVVGMFPTYTDTSGTQVTPTNAVPTLSADIVTLPNLLAGTPLMIDANKVLTSVMCSSNTEAGGAYVFNFGTTNYNVLVLTGLVTLTTTALATNAEWHGEFWNTQATNCTLTWPSGWTNSGSFIGGWPNYVDAYKKLFVAAKCTLIANDTNVSVVATVGQ